MSIIRLGRCSIATALCIVSCGPPQSVKVEGSTVVRLSDSDPNCPNGGNVLSYGVDKNGNGILDPDEVAGTFDICNGANGSLTQVQNLPAGSPCAQGGALINVGPDSNGSGILDADEVTSSTPICSADGNITSVLGNVTLQNNIDLANFAAVETISGNLQLNLAGFTGTAILPNLTTVGLNVVATFNSEQEDDLTLHNRQIIIGNSDGTSLPTAALSMPALQTVGGLVQIAPGLTLSAPQLISVQGLLDCVDPNAVLTSLTSVSGELECGNLEQMADLTSVGATLSPSGPTVDLPVLQSVGITHGIFSYYGISLTDPNITSVNMPALTQASALYLYQVASNAASIALPLLSEVGGVFLYGQLGEYSPNPPPQVFDYNTVTAPLLTTARGDFYSSNTSSSAYAALYSTPVTIGGILDIEYTGYSALTASALTSAGALQAAGNSGLTTFAAPALTTLTPGDPNFSPYRRRPGGSYVSADCYSSSLGYTPSCAMALFADNPNLADLNLGSLSTIPGVLAIINAPKLTTLVGLSSLTDVAGSAYVYNLGSVNAISNASLVVSNTGIANLTGLGSITNAGGTIAIINNSSLTDISALTLTGSASTCPIFRNDPQLPYCAVTNKLAAYNAACVPQGTASQLGLLDPCASAPCTGNQVCSPNCSTPNTPYSCN